MRPQPRQPLPGSRQSKLSIIDGVIPPRPPRASSQRSMRIGGQRPPRSVRRPNVSTVVNGRVAPNFQTRNRHFTPNSRGRVLTTSTDALSTYSNYETLEFFPLVVGHEEPEIFSEGLQYDGWMSEADARYPIDVILGFEHVSNVYKVYLTVADHLVPSKVEILVGKGRNREEDEEPTYLTARKAAFELKATMRFDKRRTDMEERETKVGFIDSECQYLWLLFYAPHPSSLNQTNQIRISGLTVEGYKLGAWLEILKVVELVEFLPFLGSSVSDGDGWRSNGENLAADPLMAIRLVRNLLKKKRKRSLKRGRDVEATVCQRAIETLNGYEKQMTEIRSKMSEALQQENVEEAKKQELALIDCRDTAFRVIHLDLLLEKTELRAIGVQSKWSDSMSLR
ncbi:hypothetical protein M3Y97_00568300 [Aphelenchoides bicaudatus]|nr:hypothetical protein M3Y97_00568300 [Aphelenchoides bicaudatus]